MIFKNFKFSLSDIVIADVDSAINHEDNIHKFKSVFESYNIKEKDGEIVEKRLYQKIDGKKSYAGKYFLQDIAFKYRKFYKKQNSLLLFIENHGEYYEIFAITTRNVFDENSCQHIKVKIEEDGSIAKHSQNKFDAIIRYADYLADEIIVFSEKDTRYTLIDDIKDGDMVSIDKIVYLTVGQMKDFFDKLKPIKKSNSLAVFIGVSIFVAIFTNQVISGYLDVSGRVTNNHNNELSSIEMQIKSQNSKRKRLEREKEKYKKRTTTKMKSFNPKSDWKGL